MEWWHWVLITLGIILVLRIIFPNRHRGRRKGSDVGAMGLTDAVDGSDIVDGIGDLFDSIGDD